MTTPASNRRRIPRYIALTTLVLMLSSGCTPRNKWTCIRVPTGERYSTQTDRRLIVCSDADRHQDIWVIEKPAPTDFAAVDVCVKPSHAAPRHVHIIGDGADIVGIEETPDGSVRTIHRRLPNAGTDAARLHVWKFRPTECRYETRLTPAASGEREITYTTVIIKEGVNP